MEKEMGSAEKIKDVWVAADCLVSPLGENSRLNFDNLRKGISGLKQINDQALSPQPIVAGSITTIRSSSDVSRFEAMCIQAIEGISNIEKISAAHTLFILSTTKGNISLLDEGQADHNRIHLHTTAAFLAKKFGFKNHIVISNACVSGVMALIVAKRYLQAAKYDHAVVVGADTLSQFVISGFQSLQALSNEPCKPFDEQRKGINLGEAAAAVLLTSKPGELKITPVVKITGGGLSNDANHISGPSRTGEELSQAIRHALAEAEMSADAIDFISSHGTATVYNDEMEAKAFQLAGLADVPVNSLKGYYGHTLGAAGIVETVMSIHSLLNNELIPTKGFQRLGVSQRLNVIEKSISVPLNNCLKTASGFGGCNAALVLQKVKS